MKLNIIKGTIKTLGGISLEAITSGAISDGAYSDIVFQDEEGREIVAKKVHAPARVNRLLQEGKTGTFIIGKVHPIFGVNKVFAARVDGKEADDLDVGMSYYLRQYVLYFSGLFLGLLFSFLLLGIPVFLYCLFMIITLPLSIAKIRKAALNSGFKLAKHQSI